VKALMWVGSAFNIMILSGSCVGPAVVESFYVRLHASTRSPDLEAVF
jgi:hypothetical protein